jgi:hypothetical protein
MQEDIFKAITILKAGKKEFIFYRLSVLEELYHIDLTRVPFSIRLLLEAALRQCNRREITQYEAGSHRLHIFSMLGKKQVTEWLRSVRRLIG